VAEHAAPRRRSWLAWLLMLAAGASGALAFGAVSMTINAQPPLEDFQGWIAVLQREPAVPTDHQVRLSARPVIAGAPGAHPALIYDVGVCGKGRFRGALFIGGAARLSEVIATPPLAGAGATIPNRATFTRVPDLRFASAATAEELNLGPVQILDLDFPSPPECVAPFSPDPSGTIPFSGQVQLLTGHVAAPVQRPATGPFGLWNGPRSSQAWPLVGRFPRVPSNYLGEFDASRGVRGKWGRPLREYTEVSVGDLRQKALVEIARPDTTSTTALSWQASMPIQPSARVLNSDGMTAWQQGLVLATIWLTIAGGVLAAALFERVRPSLVRQDAPRIPADGGTSRVPATRPLGAGDVLLAVAVATFLRLLSRRR
jgi:hypothetical protein